VRRSILARMLRLTREQVREIDRSAIEEFHIPGIVLMENAARSFVDAVADQFPKNDEIAILCGGGNNGGDGLAIARHLHNRGYQVSVVMAAPPEQLKAEALANWNIISRMKLYARHSKDGVFILRESSLIIDALFGTGLSRPIGPEYAGYIEACNWEGTPFECPVIAVDIPSGLDCNTGEPLGDLCVRADRTVTFVAEKAGFANPASKQFTGEIMVGCIGCPRELIEEVAKMMPT
jgi:NAD(P)H-hydrate epimerase